MGLFCYKMFNPGLKCRDYQFKVGVNECEHATCVRNGFHAAENPLDCLSYYPNFDKSECWLCYADGEVHENGSDSKISCTHIEILRRLTKWEFVYEAVQYILLHPNRPLHDKVEKGTGSTSGRGWTIVIGEEPKAKACANGDVVALLVTARSGRGYEKVVFLYGDEVKKGTTYRAWRDEDECE